MFLEKLGFYMVCNIRYKRLEFVLRCCMIERYLKVEFKLYVFRRKGEKMGLDYIKIEFFWNVFLYYWNVEVWYVAKDFSFF